MKVLSLFDGISCGRVALERAGIPVEEYHAFEIDKYAIQISKKNYPDIVHHGDVFDGDFTKFKGYDLLLGGSPCTYWSIAKKDRETTSDGMGFKLFMEYVRALKESECKYFLYENNFSIHKNIKAEISKYLGVEPIMINSALVSAQSRKRCYWTNIPNVRQPEDKGIFLKDVLESSLPWQDKSYAYTTRCQGAIFKDTLKKHRHTMLAEPIVINDVNGKSRTIKSQYSKTCLANASRNSGFGATMAAEPICVNSQSGNSTSPNQKQPSLSDRIYNTNGKNPALTSVYLTNIAEPVIIQRGHGYNKGGVKVDKSPTLTSQGSWQQNNFIAEPVRIGTIEHGGNKAYDSKQWRVYSVKGKSVTLCGQGGGVGAKTGLYKIDLPDGDYIIRKLTPLEAERLQTLPYNYTAGISNTQRYKCIGNGWTVDVIAHILGGIKND